jgi:hypothetical protein
MVTMEIHESITMARILVAHQRRNESYRADPGFCIACGIDVEGIDHEHCKACGALSVYGIEELVTLLF